MSFRANIPFPDTITEAPDPLLRRSIGWLVVLGVIAAGLACALPATGIGVDTYTAAHTFLETVCIAIAAMVFGLGWNADSGSRPNMLTILACTSIATGLSDLLHTLSYPGMATFVTPASPAKAIHFWLAARYLSASALLVVALLPWRPFASPHTRYYWLAASIALAGAVGWIGLYRADWIPVMFIPGQGLSPLKVGLEYALILLHTLIALIFLYRARQSRSPAMIYLMASSATTALSELFFSRYVAIDDLTNLVGHLYKAVAYLFIYRGVFVEGVREPYLRLLASEQALKDSEARFQSLLAFAPDGMLLLDWQGRIAMVNRQAEILFGYRQSELQGHGADMLMPERFATIPGRLLNRLVRRRSLLRNRDVVGRRKDGSEFFASITLAPLETDQGPMLIADVRDISERKQIEEERARLAAILEATTDLVGIIDADQHPVYLNRAGRKLLQLEQGDDPSTVTIERYHPPQVYQQLVQEALPAAARDGVWSGETALLTRDGRQTPLSQVVIAHKQADGKLLYWSTIARDISELKAYEHRVSFQATHDALTALPNRLLFRDRLGQLAQRAKRENQPGAVMLLDLDDFKTVNDLLGHDLGDEVLKLIAQRLHAALREEDTLARIGADEFAILLPDVEHVLQAVHVAQALLAAIAAPLSIADHKLLITAAVGVTLFPLDGDDVDTLLSHATMAAQRAKQTGRNIYQFYTAEMNVQVRRRVEISSNLPRALEAREFLLHYQPRVNLKTGAICGLEALIRWNHPEKGLISPDQFIPVAEETGLIVPLGEWVLAEACGQAKRWSDDGLSYGQVAVNLSACQFAQHDLQDMVARVIADSGIAPDRLDLELTESTLMRDEVSAIAVLKRLRALGVHLAVDDFGTGYSSLAYLKRFPIDYLKIDRSFIRDLMVERDNATIVQAIISLAHNLDLKVIAEGAETSAQVLFLLALHCDEMQGYYFSRPLPADAMTAMLRAGTTLELTEGGQD